MRLADPPNTTPRCLEKLPFAPDSTVHWRRRAAAPPFERPPGAAGAAEAQRQLGGGGLGKVGAA